jgi:hypothetical protein
LLRYALVAAAAVALTLPLQAGAATPGDVVEAQGIVAIDQATDTWVVVNGATHEPVNLGGVVCDPTSGKLIVDTPDVTQVIGGYVAVDEKYAGVIEAGPSIGLTSMTIELKDHDGTFVRCDGSLADKTSSNLFVGFKGIE